MPAPEIAQPNLNLIPEVTQTIIISFLDPKTFVMLTRVSKNFQTLINQQLPLNIHRFYGLFKRPEFAPFSAIEKDILKQDILKDNTLYLELAGAGLRYKIKSTDPKTPHEGEILGIRYPADLLIFLNLNSKQGREEWARFLHLFDYHIMSTLLERKHIILSQTTLPGYKLRPLNHALYFLAERSAIDKDFYRIFCDITIPSPVVRELVYQRAQVTIFENNRMTLEPACPDLFLCIENLPQICNSAYKANALWQQEDLHQLLPKHELCIPTKFEVWQRTLVLQRVFVKKAIYYALTQGFITGLFGLVLALLLGLPLVLMIGSLFIAGVIGSLLTDLAKFIRYINVNYKSLSSTVKSRSNQYQSAEVKEQPAEIALPKEPRDTIFTSDLTYSFLFFNNVPLRRRLPEEHKSLQASL